MDTVPEGVRLFLALDLPDAARATIGRWRDLVVPGRNELRPLPDEALHVTLVFLGRRPREYVERVWETTAGSIRGLTAPTLTAIGAAWVPPRRSRVLALDLEDRNARAAAVHESLGAALQGAGLHEPEQRPLWPHVTVARVRANAKVRERDLPAPPTTSFTARHLTLYRSDLHPAGARYVALERLELA